jgi:hypothetical protein
MGHFRAGRPELRRQPAAAYPGGGRGSAVTAA